MIALHTHSGSLAAKTERDLAQLTIALLRDGGVPDDEILSDYTPAQPQSDHAYEQQFHRDHGIRIAAKSVKAWMRRLLTC